MSLPPRTTNERFRQTTNIVTVETDQGITGIGEGGMKDTLELFASMLIGEDPSRIEHIWQVMYRGLFSPAGRERLRAVGAVDMALWDIKGKALGVPVHQLLGGPTRDHLECYSTGFPRKGSLKETAQACLEAGFRVYRTGAVGEVATAFSIRECRSKRLTTSVAKSVKAWGGTGTGPSTSTRVMR